MADPGALLSISTVCTCTCHHPMGPPAVPPVMQLYFCFVRSGLASALPRMLFGILSARQRFHGNTTMLLTVTSEKFEQEQCLQDAGSKSSCPSMGPEWPHWWATRVLSFIFLIYLKEISFIYLRENHKSISSIVYRCLLFTTGHTFSWLK